MTALGKLFAESPFGPLASHTEKTHQCVMLIKDLFAALLAEDWNRLEELQPEMSKLEHEADLFKSEVREHLSKAIFLPVDRSVLVRFLKEQDDIADAAEDVAVLLVMRKTVIHEELKAPLLAYVQKVIDTSERLLDAANAFKDAMESNFKGPDAERVAALSKEVSVMEWETDKMRRELSKKTFELEDQLDPVTILFYTKIFIALGEIADHAENTADNLRLMVKTK